MSTTLSAGQTIADIGRDYVLPIGMSILGGPAGAVAGSFLSGTMQDKSTEDLALNAAIAGGTAYGMQQISPYVNTLFSPKDYGLFGKYSSGVSPYSSAASFAGPSSALYSGADLSSTLDPGAVGAGAYGPSTGGVSNVGGIEQALVRPGAFYPGVGALAGVIPAQFATSSPSYAGPGVEEVNVLGKRAPVTDEYGAPFLLPTALAALTPAEQWLTSQAAKNAAEPIVGEPSKEPSTLDKYLRYASAGLTGASLLGGLFGGSGAGAKDGTGTIPQGFSTALPSTFSAKLPTGSAIPAFGGGVTPESRMGRTAADLGDIDYTRYGFGPERSFFTNVPQRAAKGGAMAAKPISDGRSDDIPAVLSDGEYVIDAETVALLGNGSNKAGAKQLDRFRANIRKHKGKELAKGRFSVDAKKPQAYLAGGRT